MSAVNLHNWVQTRISQVSQFSTCKYCDNHGGWSISLGTTWLVRGIMVSGVAKNGPTAPVLAGPVFLKVKKISPFFTKSKQ